MKKIAVLLPFDGLSEIPLVEDPKLVPFSSANNRPNPHANLLTVSVQGEQMICNSKLCRPGKLVPTE